MAQVFSPKAVLVVKLTGLGLLVLLCLIVIAWRWRMTPADKLLAVVEQPIPFSHKHHAGDDGLDCRYCHTAVEKSRFAGMPSTETCLTCHSQLYRDAPMLAPLHASARTGKPIEWKRVHDLPGFVYFDHSIHIAKGVACSDCHGDVDRMPLTMRTASLEMQWCLSCHRNPEQHVARYRDEYGGDIVRVRQAFHLLSTQRLTDCSTCHR